METYHSDVLTTFHRDVIGCFIWDAPATLLGRAGRRRYEVPTTFLIPSGYVSLNYILLLTYKHLSVLDNPSFRKVVSCPQSSRTRKRTLKTPTKLRVIEFIFSWPNINFVNISFVNTF